MKAGRIIVVALAGAALPVLALACRCAGNNIAVGYGRAFAVVVGVVDGTRAVEPVAVGSGSVASVSVARAWKHDVPARIEVATQTTCAFDWTAGHTYALVLFSDANGRLSTGQCFGNAEVPGAALDWLNRHGRAARVVAD